MPENETVAPPAGEAAAPATPPAGEAGSPPDRIPAELMPLVNAFADKVVAKKLQEQADKLAQDKANAELSETDRLRAQNAKLEATLAETTSAAVFNDRVAALLAQVNGRIPASVIRSAVRDHVGEYDPAKVLAAATAEVNGWAAGLGIKLDAPPPPPLLPGAGGSPPAPGATLTNEQVNADFKAGRITLDEANALWNKIRADMRGR